MVKDVLEDDEERAIGNTYNIEVMRRNRLHCSYDFIEGRQLRETKSPVVTSWLLLNDEDNEFYNIPANFISKSWVIHSSNKYAVDFDKKINWTKLFLLGCDHEPLIAKRNVQQPSPHPMEFITVTGELRPVNLTCVAVGEFGSNIQVVTVNVIGK